MHIFFSGIGGTGIGPIAQIAHQAGFDVSGSDKRDSSYIKYLQQQGLKNINIGQEKEFIAKIHQQNPIDWFVYSSAIQFENQNSEEIIFCQSHNIKTSKRDQFVNYFIKKNQLKMIAIAGTHGKTTLTAMVVYLFKSLNIPLTYVLPAKTSFGQMGEYNSKGSYFVYEADEFDRNFLSFQPFQSIISGLAYDHQEIYSTHTDYLDAFSKFINQSNHTILYQRELSLFKQNSLDNVKIFDQTNSLINKIKLLGKYNRQDAYLALQSLLDIKPELSIDDLIEIINNFPGLSRRMEKIKTNLYTDYAHTPEKIKAAINVAQELCNELKKQHQTSGKIIIVYEPLTNRRQHYIKEQYKNLFNKIDKLYWVPSYLAREDPSLDILKPENLLQYLSEPKKAQSQNLNEQLKNKINQHLKNNDLVIALSGGGGDSLDEWLRKNFQ